MPITRKCPRCGGDGTITELDIVEQNAAYRAQKFPKKWQARKVTDLGDGKAEIEWWREYEPFHIEIKKEIISKD